MISWYEYHDTQEGTQVKNNDRTEPLWNVILHNDWDNSMPRVVLILEKVSLGMSIRKAAAIMYAAHLTGKAVVKRCYKELAELYKELLQGEWLKISLEPAR
jgi:ATP-dependent Clp protease adaptor protein ClpS